MGKSIKIAIYTGIVPSTTFIERLIIGLAENSLQVYLFGIQKKKIKPLKNIYNLTYSNKLGKLMLLIKYSLLLIFFKAREKRILDDIILNKNKNTRHLKIKYYPVLYHQPEIFHLQWAKSIKDWIWVQEFGIKLIVSLRGAHINYSPLTIPELATDYKNLFPRVDGFHAVSSAIAKESIKYKAFEKKIKVIFSGLDLNQLSFHNRSFDSKPPLSIISIGRDHWKKGYSYALDAMKLLDNENIDFKYTIIGVDKNEELLYKRSNYKLEKNITFKEKMSFSDIIEEIKQAKVLLLSSIEEGIANVVLEAMALGTLAISTNCGGMSEVIKNEENGLLVPIRNTRAIATALKKVSNMSNEDYSDITKCARETIEKQHNFKAMISKMIELYETVLKEEL